MGSTRAESSHSATSCGSNRTRCPHFTNGIRRSCTNRRTCRSVTPSRSANSPTLSNREGRGGERSRFRVGFSRRDAVIEHSMRDVTPAGPTGRPGCKTHFFSGAETPGHTGRDPGQSAARLRFVSFVEGSGARSPGQRLVVAGLAGTWWGEAPCTRRSPEPRRRHHDPNRSSAPTNSPTHPHHHIERHQHERSHPHHPRDPRADPPSHSCTEGAQFVGGPRTRDCPLCSGTHEASKHR